MGNRILSEYIKEKERLLGKGMTRAREGNERKEKFKMRSFLSLICYLRVGPGFWGEVG